MHIDYQGEFMFEVIVEPPDVHLKYAVELCSPRNPRVPTRVDRCAWPLAVGEAGAVAAGNRSLVSPPQPNGEAAS